MKSLPVRIDKRSHWTSLTAEYVLPVSERPSFYALDLVTAYKTDKSGFWQDFGHAWIRLITPAGEVMSVGYFPDESTHIVPEKQPGLRFPGVLLHPDKYNSMRFKEKITRIALQEEKFFDLKNWLLRLQNQRVQKCLSFSLVDLNCVWFVVEAARQVGINVRAAYTLREACWGFIRHLLRSKERKRNQLDPHSSTVANIVFNFGLAILGGRNIHTSQWIEKNTKERVLIQHSDLQPVFSCWRDILLKPVTFYHVRSLRHWQSINPEIIFPQ
jgi:hypothetical protein